MYIRRPLVGHQAAKGGFSFCILLVLIASCISEVFVSLVDCCLESFSLVVWSLPLVGCLLVPPQIKILLSFGHVSSRLGSPKDHSKIIKFKCVPKTRKNQKKYPQGHQKTSTCEPKPSSRTPNQ